MDDFVIERLNVWTEYGVILEKDNAVEEVRHIYISVPLLSDFTDGRGNELSGVILNRYVKRSLGDAAVVHSRTRQENWTQARAANRNYKPPEKSKDQAAKDKLNDIFRGIFGGDVF